MQNQNYYNGNTQTQTEQVSKNQQGPYQYSQPPPPYLNQPTQYFQQPQFIQQPIVPVQFLQQQPIVPVIQQPIYMQQPLLPPPPPPMMMPFNGPPVFQYGFDNSYHSGLFDHHHSGHHHHQYW
jgi:hypothetical protein